MRETTRSLSLYFMLVGGLTVLGTGFVLTAALNNGTAGFFELVLLFQGLVGAAYLYVGAKLKTLLVEKPQLPMKLATLAIVLSCLGFNILGLLLNVYIYYQLKRMVREATPEMESQVLQ